MTTKKQNDSDARETDPWWAKYWYASAIALAIWMIAAIYAAINYELELKNARIIVRETVDGNAIGVQICQIELWWLVIAIPFSLAIVNSILAFLDRKNRQAV